MQAIRAILMLSCLALFVAVPAGCDKRSTRTTTVEREESDGRTEVEVETTEREYDDDDD